MARKIKLSILIALLNILFALGLMIIFSPYGKKDGYPYSMVMQSIVINASADSVYNYLGNSANAHFWSVYVHHISTLNKDSVPDGQVGSIRRCFRNKNEQGKQWDEMTIINEKNKRRKLSIYNTKGFALMVDSIATEQIYYSLGPNKCRLIFTLGLYGAPVSLLDKLKIYFASYFIADIFKKNIDNIKRINEKKALDKSK